MKLGLPPAVDRLRAIAPTIREVAPGTTLVRLYFRGGEYPTTWNTFRTSGPHAGRFDHHLPEALAVRGVDACPGTAPPGPRGILYAALDGLTCLAEVYQETRQIDREHKAPWMAVFATLGRLRLLDLTGRWPTRAGASGAIATGRRDYAQAWSRTIYEAYPDLDGLYYRSSMDPEGYCLALYERAAAHAVLPPRPLFHRGLADACWRPILTAAAAKIGYRLC